MTKLNFNDIPWEQLVPKAANVFAITNVPFAKWQSLANAVSKHEKAEYTFYVGDAGYSLFRKDCVY